MVFGVDLIEHLRVDDPIGAVAVHGFCGIWGTLSLGLFATGQFGVPGPTGADTSTVVEGLFWGGGADQLGSQIIGSATVTVDRARRRSGADVRGEGDQDAAHLGGGRAQGIDIHEHGAPAYHPEPAYMGASFSGGCRVVRRRRR